MPRSHGPTLRHPDELAGRPGWALDLYWARVGANLSLYALDALTGISFASLSKYENGRVRPSPETEARIRAAIASVVGDE